MIAQSVYIGKPDYNPEIWKVYGVLTAAYKNNKIWFCVGIFDQAYFRPKTMISRRNRTCWKGKYGVPFNDNLDIVRMVAEDSFTALHEKLYKKDPKEYARTLEEVQVWLDIGDNPLIWSTRRKNSILDPNDPTKIIYNPPVVLNTFDEIDLPNLHPEEFKPLLKDAIERCVGQLMSEVLLATTDYFFQNEGEWDFLKEEGAV